MNNPVCLFCNPLAFQSFIIYETHLHYLMLDKYPASFGHLLIIPKKHFSNITELDQAHLIDQIALIQFAAKHLKNIIKECQMTIITSDGIHAEQSVPHLHWHLIPRYENDLIKIDLNECGEQITNEEINQLKNLFNHAK